MTLRPRDIKVVGRALDELEAIKAQLATASLVRRSPDRRAERNRHSYRSNEDFWADVLGGKLRGRRVVDLQEFAVTEWIPRSPGLYHTNDGRLSREEAQRCLYPLSAHEREQYNRTDPQAGDVYTTNGKRGMISGGLGCLRLRDKVTENGRLWFMGASSSFVAHEGILIGVNEADYHRIIDAVSERGALLCNLTGYLEFVPSTLDALYSGYAEVPMTYVHIERLTPLPGHPRERQPLASAAVTFRSKRQEWSWDEVFESAYIDFTPGRIGSLDRRLPWLQHYVENMYDGIVVTDFDEQMRHFADAVFALVKVSNGTLDIEQMEGLLQSAGRPRINVGTILLEQSQLNIVRAQIGGVQVGDTFSNIGAGATIINRSTLDNAVVQLRTKSGDYYSAALKEVAEHVEQSGDADAVDNLNGFIEELEQPEPRKPRLRAFWSALLSALPSVAELGESAVKLAELANP